MEERNPKIINFDRPADFYFKAALKMMEGANYLSALSMMRKALSKGPGNIKYMMTLAEILTELSKYEESNSVLFEILLKTEEVCNECYFAMGCNFMGLGDFEKARESFEKYLAVAPEGEFGEEVEEFLALFYDLQEEEEYMLEDANELRQQELAQQGKKHLDSCEYQRAVDALEKIDETAPELLFAKNNLALSYYCLQKIDEAVKITERVLKIDPDNIHANCNMAMFVHRKDAVSAHRYVQKAAIQKKATQDDFYKIAITFCEIGEHKEALHYLTNILATSPYDEKVLFCAAMASFNNKRYNDAIKYLSNILKLNPDDSIASYYLRNVKDVMDGKIEHQEKAYVFQVPPQEAKSRIQYLNNKMKLPDEEFKQLWKTDKKLKEVLLWGLEYGDTFIKRAAVEIISGFEDEKAEKVFRRFILRRDQPDDIKNEIFVALKRMKAAEPYVAYFNESIVEVKVGILDQIEEIETKDFDRLFDLLVSVVSKEYSEQLAGKAVSLLQEFMESKKGTTYLTETKEFAAAIAFSSLYFNDIVVEPKKIAGIFDADVNRLSAIAMDIMNIVEKKEEK